MRSTRNELIVGVIIAIISIIVSITNPEIRRILGLDKPEQPRNFDDSSSNWPPADQLRILSIDSVGNGIVLIWQTATDLPRATFTRFDSSRGLWEPLRRATISQEVLGPGTYSLTDTGVIEGIRYCYRIHQGEMQPVDRCIVYSGMLRENAPEHNQQSP